MIICFIELVCGQRHRSEVAKLCYLGPVPLSTTQFYEAYDHADSPVCLVSDLAICRRRKECGDTRNRMSFLRPGVIK